MTNDKAQMTNDKAQMTNLSTKSKYQNCFVTCACDFICHLNFVICH